MVWCRLGQIYTPDGKREWARSHASLPVPVHLDGDRFRVFFSTRDAAKRSSIAWVDIVLDETPRVVAEAKVPVLSCGTPGMFDDSGASIGSIVRDRSGDRLYYMGWNLGKVAPWRNSIGLADGDAAVPFFERRFLGPIMDRAPEDPFTLSYPWVLRLAPDDWRMWYGSHTQWGETSADMHHVIKAARSSDGVRWVRRGQPIIEASRAEEYALARPAVLYERGLFHMWFAARGDRYQIGYAVSQDGIAWRRDDAEYGLSVCPEGWDSEMTCYPCPIRHKGHLYLAYNGNGYGLSGIGLARWVPPSA